MPPCLDIEGVRYDKVVERRNGTAVYRGVDTFARVGSETVLNHDKRLHRQIESLGFPVAKLLSEGKVGEFSYYTETSLGTQRITDLFASDMKAIGEISDEHFEQFLGVTRKCCEVQLHTATDEKDVEAFAHGIQIDVMEKERPDLVKSIRTRFESAVRELEALPFVLTHGDLNPANMFPTGVIDFEDVFSAPFGYDVVTALVTTDWFPLDEGYEYRARYRFSTEQKEVFMTTFDDIFTAAGLKSFSSYFDSLSFCRGVWHVVRMDKYPLIQKWRYELFERQFLS